MIKNLTRVSNQNINTIFENYSHHLNHAIKNKGFIKTIYHLIKSYPHRQEEFKISKEIPKVSSTYMSPEISHFIKTHNFDTYKTKFTMYNTNINLTICSIHPIEVQTYLFYIKLVLHFCLQSASKKHTEIHFKLIFTDIGKTCPTIPVEPYHINSGQTDPNKNEIMIFRKEEWLKVFIHECFHLFSLDFCDVDINYNKMFKDLYNIESEFLLFEAYTEFWARTMNLSIVSYFTVKNIRLKEFERIMIINIQVERLYCMAQMNHLLNRMGLTYESLFQELKFREKTNFFCYYILTSVLFYNYGDTMLWFMNNNTNLLQFSNKNVHIFFEFIKQRYRAPDFLTFIKQINKPLHNCNMAAFDINF
jgi:hypothetical protein